MGRHVVIRADASQVIGSGHVMRCLTLAERLRRRGEDVTFVSRELPGNLIAHESHRARRGAGLRGAAPAAA